MRLWFIATILLLPLAGATPACACESEGEVHDRIQDAPAGADLASVSWHTSIGDAPDRTITVRMAGGLDPDLKLELFGWTAHADGVSSAEEFVCITILPGADVATVHAGGDARAMGGELACPEEHWLDVPFTMSDSAIVIDWPAGFDAAYSEYGVSCVMFQARVFGEELLDHTQAVPRTWTDLSSTCPVPTTLSCQHCEESLIPAARPELLALALLGLARLGTHLR